MRVVQKGASVSERNSDGHLRTIVDLFGDAAVLLRWEGAADDVLESVIPAVQRRVVALGWPGVVDVVPGFESLTVCFDPRQCSARELAGMLERQAECCDRSSGIDRSEHRIPVRFSREDGPDLEEVAGLAGLSVRGCIELLASCCFRVRMIGFAPGFPYLSGLPDCLRVPRLATPRRSVPAGSFAIAAGQAGIYPQSSPGGWRLLGRTEQRLFDPLRSRPSLLQAGDLVRIEPCGPMALPGNSGGGAGQP